MSLPDWLEENGNLPSPWVTESELVSMEQDTYLTFSIATVAASTAVAATPNNDNGKKTFKKSKRCRNFYKRDQMGNWLIPHIPLPRIPKTDIRRDYGLFFTNVYNSGDGQLLHKFLSQMFHPEHVFYLSVQGQSYALDLGQSILYRFCYENMCISPDIFFAFKAQRIKLRSDQTATVIGRFQISGTMLLHDSMDEKLLQIDALMCPSFYLQHDTKRIGYVYPRNNSNNTANNHDDADFDIRMEEDVGNNTNNTDNIAQSIVVEGKERDFSALQELKHSKYLFLIDGNNHTDVAEVYTQPKLTQYDISGEFVLEIDTHYRLTAMQMSMLHVAMNNHA